MFGCQDLGHVVLDFMFKIQILFFFSDNLKVQGFGFGFGKIQ